MELEKINKELREKIGEQDKNVKSTIEQLSLVSTTAKRDQGILTSKESENKLLSEE